jgi:hypothetical protein
MKGIRKDRRSKRVPASHRLLLTLLSPSGTELAREIVSTVELSQYGAHIRGRRHFEPESEAVLTQLSSGRQARVRVAWQEKSGAHHGLFDTGVELLSGFDFWGVSFTDPATGQASGAAEAAPSFRDILDELVKQSADDPGTRIMETVWCGVVDHLEARELIQRDELVQLIRAVVGGLGPVAVKV